MGRRDIRLEARRCSCRDMKCLLKMLVEDIQKSICESPHEEQNSDERDWDDRLACSDLSGACHSMVVHTSPAATILNSIDC
jgi:hypothetical protein